ncbi:Tkp4 protein [Vanderwaltozyma polyspora DSM 70294]|uniref:Tkp4 protein n=1 Tax=Vanderwaltozyma polyspora (strain ATCC 22028 / DSM 70294 / BCRC 21397 / CBS 2163 / NBRC 10782 / NRRL Y-8283 / UCD 57-17) TaxID=436907 RepID=A7TG93_VANPO|nr:Tkp4 protein [Vanderwaltozyma polyspora DSM 70294]EDO18663.1 Tkp4 protein [Vanderwaltozyma polyspora DSM 70294]
MLLYTKVLLLTLKTFPTLYIRNDEILIDTYHMYYIPMCILYTLIHWININLLRMSLEINKESITMNDSVEKPQHNSLQKTLALLYLNDNSIKSVTNILRYNINLVFLYNFLYVSSSLL